MLQERPKGHLSNLLWTVKVPLLIAFFFVVCEVCVFNLPFWQTLGAKPVRVDAIKLGPGLERVSSHTVKVVDESKEYWEISGPESISYFYVNPSHAEFTSQQSPWMMDTRKPTDGGWYNSDRAVRYSPKYDNSRYFHVGNGATSLRFRYKVPKGTVIPIPSLTVNPKVPYRLPLARVGLEVFLALLIILFRPGSAMYKRRFSVRDPMFVLGLVSVFAIETAWLIFIWANWGGDHTADFPIKKTDNSIWAFNQYQHLANSLINGHVNLDFPVNKGLAKMQNPYDTPTRLSLPTKDAPIFFDVAFKDGKYYCYFGVLPALVAFVPYKLLTGMDLSTGAAILAFDIVVLVVAAVLVMQIARLVSRRGHVVSLGTVLLVYLGFPLGLGLMKVMQHQFFYQLPQTLALALILLGISCWIEAKLRGLSKVWLAAGSLCIALTIVSRPQFIFASLAALPLFWKDICALFRGGLHSLRGFGKEAGVWVCALAPYIVVFVPAMLYNRARFGGLFNFGANYNLTGFDMTHYRLPWSETVSFLFMYFFQPPNISNAYPFFRVCDEPVPVWMPIQLNYGGLFTLIAPFALVIFSLWSYRRQLRHLRLTSLCAWLSFCGLLVFAFDSHLVSYDSRYILDFGWAFMMLFAITVFVVDGIRRDAPQSSLEEKAVQGGRRGFASAMRPLSMSSRRTIGWVLAGVVLAWVACFFLQCTPDPTPDNERLWWNVSSWFLFV